MTRSHVVAHLVSKYKRQGAARILWLRSQYDRCSDDHVTHIGSKAVASRDRRVVGHTTNTVCLANAAGDPLGSCVSAPCQPKNTVEVYWPIS